MFLTRASRFGSGGAAFMQRQVVVSSSSSIMMSTTKRQQALAINGLHRINNTNSNPSSNRGTTLYFSTKDDTAMTKATLAKKLSTAENIGNLSQEQSKKIVDYIFDTMTQSLKDRQKITIYKFGTFENKTSKARKARNPKTGEAIDVPEKQRVSFNASTTLKGIVNE